MERYKFSEEERKFIERSSIPFAIYQFIDKRVVTVALSEGHRQLIGTDTIEEAMALMDDDMYRDIHPDDIAKTASAALKFATEDAKYDVLYRLKHGDEWLVIHSTGRHVYTEDGVRLAEVSYTNEGVYDPNVHSCMLSLDHFHEMYFQNKGILDKTSFDYLTGLPDMNYFFELAETAHEKATRQGKYLSMVFLDLNGMQVFNQSYGYKEGDNLIKAMGRLLASTFTSENCCRTTADHFVFYDFTEGLDKKIEKLIEDAKTINSGRTLPVKIGIYNSAIQNVNAATATDRAKIACDTCGSVYESSVNYFDMKMLKQFEDRKYVFENLDKALDEGWIKVYYQPIVRTANEKVCDEEALVRWDDPKKGLMSPAEFIPILEDAKIVYKLDLYVLDKVLEKLKRQIELGLYVVPNSINLSRTDFYACDIVEEIRKRVDASGVDRSRITIEITESIIMDDMEFMMVQVNRFRELGFGVWLDDFGSGYSAPDILQKVRFDVVKLDKVFIDQIEENEESRVIITELLRLSNGLGCETVAEGVETKGQLDFLNEIGCTRIQGFYYCKPITHDEIFMRYQKGTQIGFENPDESEYYETLGNVNLYDVSFASEEDNEALHDYFNTMPMVILEIDDEEINLARGNKSFREFMARHYKEIYDVKHDKFSHVKTILSGTFLDALVECKDNGKPVVVETRTRSNGIVSVLVRKIATNPVTGVVALALTILGYDDDDAEIRHKEAIERINKERKTYARVSALFGDVYCIYNVDPVTDRYFQFALEDRYTDMRIDIEGENFFDNLLKYGLSMVYEEDKERFKEDITKELILKEVEKKGMFSYGTRLVVEGEIRFVAIRATMIEEDEDRQLVVGVIDINEQVKKDLEYSKNLNVARAMANRDTLTGVKNKHAYVDMEIKLNKQIEEGEEVKFALTVFDLNGLKEINDTFGHQEGDKYIREGCKTICNVFKHSPVFRIGGDEFAVISENEDYDNIINLVKQFDGINVRNKKENKVVVAVGMAKYNGDRSVGAVFARADKNMYTNKKLLKNEKIL